MSNPRMRSGCSKGRVVSTLPFLKTKILPSVNRMPLPSVVGVKSMRKLPGTDIASYQVSTLDVPSGSKFVVSCTKVAVLYHDFPYFFCMVAISSFVFEIFAYDATVNGSKEIATIKNTNFIIVPPHHARLVS